jgi:hypothetical protein
VASKSPPEDGEPTPDGRRPASRYADLDGGQARPAAPRWTYGVVVVVGGLTAITLCLVAALYVYRNVSSGTDSAGAVATVLAPITGVVGTVVGAYFGIQAGSAGTAAAQAAANEAQATALEAMRDLAAITAMTPAAAAEQIHEILGVETRASRTGF